MKLTVDRRPNPTRSDSPPAKDQANSPCPQRDFGTVLRTQPGPPWHRRQLFGQGPAHARFIMPELHPFMARLVGS